VKEPLTSEIDKTPAVTGFLMFLFFNFNERVRKVPKI
jgi:hypothetical protein